MAVIIMFIMSMLLSVMFPTTDIGSDLYLSHQTLKFTGDNKVLQGCRSCFYKNEKEMLKNQEKGCETCFSFRPIEAVNNDGSASHKYNFKYSNDNEIMYLYSFTTDYCYIPIIDKALELESNSDQCNQSFQERHSYSEEGKVSISLESNECDSAHYCCLQRKTNITYNKFDKEIQWYKCIRNNRGCEMCVGNGQLTYKSCYYLQDIPDYIYEQSKPIHRQTYPWHLKNRECNPMEKPRFYKINNLTINRNEVININYEKGNCTQDDECCVLFKYAKENDKPGINQCYSDMCKLTRDRASFYVNRTLNLKEWRAIDIYNQGQNWGGRLCTSLHTYGWSILIPVIIHSMFGLLLCYNDIKSRKSQYFEIIFALFSVYPQWKVIKMWIRFAKGNINEEQLIEEKNVLDGSVSSIEPFVESCFQVHIQ